MERVAFNIPTLWADHHVLAVREALSPVAGIQEVIASSLYKDVWITYDPTTVTPEALASRLAEAGYEIAQAPGLAVCPPRIDDASDWFQLQGRVTETDMRDLEMSGDFRKY